LPLGDELGNADTVGDELGDLLGVDDGVSDDESVKLKGPVCPQ